MLWHCTGCWPTPRLKSSLFSINTLPYAYVVHAYWGIINWLTFWEDWQCFWQWVDSLPPTPHQAGSHPPGRWSQTRWLEQTAQTDWNQCNTSYNVLVSPSSPPGTGPGVVPQVGPHPLSVGLVALEWQVNQTINKSTMTGDDSTCTHYFPLGKVTKRMTRLFTLTHIDKQPAMTRVSRFSPGLLYSCVRFGGKALITTNLSSGWTSLRGWK